MSSGGRSKEPALSRVSLLMIKDWTRIPNVGGKKQQLDRVESSPSLRVQTNVQARGLSLCQPASFSTSFYSSRQAPGFLSHFLQSQPGSKKRTGERSFETKENSRDLIVSEQGGESCWWASGNRPCSLIGNKRLAFPLSLPLPGPDLRPRSHSRPASIFIASNSGIVR